MSDTPSLSHSPEQPLAQGVSVIRGHLGVLPDSPGVYRMLSAGGDALYVGKAKSLKKRVAAYVRAGALPIRLQRMVAETASLEVITTRTEVEALLLESNLIKRLKPRFNILLRDDKSFPHVLITGDHDFPRIVKHRGARKAPGEYFGPFASAWAVNHALSTLQRAFLLRTCSDSVFSARTRPCLLYQIKRCSAPCVGRIGRADYAALLDQARAFLSGDSQAVQQALAERMEEAAQRLDYEEAAAFRDRIRAMTHLQARQDINTAGLVEADVIAVHQAGGQSCIQVFFFRAGQNWGNRAYYPSHARNEGAQEVLAAFIGQFYDDKPPPPEVLVSHAPKDRGLLAEALSVKRGRKVRLLQPQRGERLKLVVSALENAREALGRRLAESATQRRLLDGVAETFGLDAPPRRIEVFDNSHIGGTGMVGAMIVSGPEGLMKNAYRTFTIRDPSAAPGDDYAMLREVLTRRFARARKEDPERSNGLWPDLVLIDGGRGQLEVARSVFDELGISEDEITVIGIAKGADRNAGRETFHMAGRTPFQLEPRDPVLYFLQRLRDEAHRFAIGAQKGKRARAAKASPLDGIEGVGARRRKALLHHFGSARAVSEATPEDLAAVEGISRALAKRIHDHFRAGG